MSEDYRSLMSQAFGEPTKPESGESDYRTLMRDALGDLQQDSQPPKPVGLTEDPLAWGKRQAGSVWSSAREISPLHIGTEGVRLGSPWQNMYKAGGARLEEIGKKEDVDLQSSAELTRFAMTKGSQPTDVFNKLFGQFGSEVMQTYARAAAEGREPTDEELGEATQAIIEGKGIPVVGKMLGRQMTRQGKEAREKLRKAGYGKKFAKQFGEYYKSLQGERKISNLELIGQSVQEVINEQREKYGLDERAEKMAQEHWATPARIGGAVEESIPFMAVIAASSAVNPALGFEAGRQMMTNMEYENLREKGFEGEELAMRAELSGGIQGILEAIVPSGAFGRSGSILGKLGGAVVSELGTETVQEATSIAAETRFTGDQKDAAQQLTKELMKPENRKRIALAGFYGGIMGGVFEGSAITLGKMVQGGSIQEVEAARENLQKQLDESDMAEDAKVSVMQAFNMALVSDTARQKVRDGKPLSRKDAETVLGKRSSKEQRAALAEDIKQDEIQQAERQAKAEAEQQPTEGTPEATTEEDTGQPTLTEAEAAQQATTDTEGVEMLGSGVPVAQERKVSRPDEVPTVEAPTPEIQQRLDAARGMEQQTTIQKFVGFAKEALIDLKNKATRAQANLANTAENAAANEFFRLLKDVPTIAADEVSRTVASIIDPMGKKQLKLFTEKLAVDNMIAALERGEPLRFGFESKEQLLQYKADLDAAVDQTPAIKQALNTRKRVVGELVAELVDRGLLSEEAQQNVDTYYHQQVLTRMKVNQQYGSESTMRRKRRSFQKKRAKGVDLNKAEYDYNMDYIEAEIEWMRDAMIEIRKDKMLKTVLKQYDIMPQLKEQAELEGVELESLESKAQSEGFIKWQPQPGNHFYHAMSVEEKVIEDLIAGRLDAKEVKQTLRDVMVMGQRKYEAMIPAELAAELDALEKPKDKGAISKASANIMKFWKIWTLLNPKRVLGYSLRNLTGDAEPVVGAAPGAFKYMPKAVKELTKYHSNHIAVSPELKAARDHGVVSSSMTAEEIPSTKDLKIFKRFNEGGPKDLLAAPIAYFEFVRDFNEWRENQLRYAAFLHYRTELNSKSGLANYGGANKAVVQEIQRTLGNDAAAAHLARNLLGDYGNMTVMGNYVRRHLIPFYSWMEVNAKRWPKLFINAAKAGSLKRNVAVKAGFGALASMQLLIPYALMQLWNNVFFPDEEDELTSYDRANPHLNLGRNEDGSIRIFRNVGALGDMAEWFGLNTLLTLFPAWEDGQMTWDDVAIEMAKDPVNKVVGGIRPDIKALFEVVPGQSFFPDVFNPRKVERGELAAGVMGLQDEWRMVQKGRRRRPNYAQRLVVGVVDPGKNASYEMYDLKERFLKAEGEYRPPPPAISKAKPLREAAFAEDAETFAEAKQIYLKEGGTRKKFIEYIKRLKPLTGIKKSDRTKFVEEFLTADQRRRLGVAERHSAKMRDLMLLYWNQTPDL